MKIEYSSELNEAGQIVINAFNKTEPNTLETIQDNISKALAPYHEFLHNYRILNNRGRLHSIEEEVASLKYLLGEKEAGNLNEWEAEMFDPLFVEYHAQVVFNFSGSYPNKMRHESLGVLKSMLRDPDLNPDSRKKIQEVIDSRSGCNQILNFMFGE